MPDERALAVLLRLDPALALAPERSRVASLRAQHEHRVREQVAVSARVEQRVAVHRRQDASSVAMSDGIEPIIRAERPIDPGTTIGHVHLRTADIDRVRDFYVGVLGFDVIAEARDVPGWGTTGDILFLCAGGYHHHLGFNTWKSAGGPPQPDGVCGLHHVALLFPTRADLADASGAWWRSTGRCAS